MPALKLTDILSDAPDGRAQLHVAGYNATLVLPARRRDFHPMGRLQRAIVGQRTPAMVWRNGIAIAEQLLRPVFMRPQDIVEMIVHESAHWWQLWRRMGPTDFPATYGWQGLIRLFRTGSAHLHDVHPVEREAQRIAAAIMLELDLLMIHNPAGVTFDVETWLQSHYPATR